MRPCRYEDCQAQYVGRSFEREQISHLEASVSRWSLDEKSVEADLREGPTIPLGYVLQEENVGCTCSTLEEEHHEY